MPTRYLDKSSMKPWLLSMVAILAFRDLILQPSERDPSKGADGSFQSTHTDFAKGLLLLSKDSEGTPVVTDKKLPPTFETGTTSSEADYTVTHAYLDSNLQAQWRVCEPSVPGAVLAFRGLRVRLGFHASLDTATSVNFNSVMQRHHYTGKRGSMQSCTNHVEEAAWVYCSA
jgi:hypothetical protein